MDLLLEHLGRGFMVMLLIAMPIVLTAAFIGLIVGIIQAVTSVQEQTIAAAPKILCVFLIIIFLGTFFANRLVDYMLNSMDLAFNVVTKNQDYALPPDANLRTFSARKYYQQMKKGSFSTKPGNIPFPEQQQRPDIKQTNPDGAARPNMMETNKIMENSR